MTKSEDRKIKKYIDRWDRQLRVLNKWWKINWPIFVSEVSNFMNQVFNFLWFPKVKTNGDKALHFLEWWLAVLIALRVLRFI